MISRKIAMLGMWGVGKTSLVRQFVSSIYDEAYHSTIGVKVDKKVVQVDGRDMNLMLWDIAGAEEDRAIPMHYLSGVAGYLLVLDGTRKESLEVGVDLVTAIDAAIGRLPFIPVINKCDLDWQLSEQQVRDAFNACPVEPLSTSAKTGENVERAFLRLAEQL
jgi:small GTP-binding protein